MYVLLTVVWIVAVIWGLLRLRSDTQAFAAIGGTVALAIPFFLDEPDLYLVWILGFPLAIWLAGPSLSEGSGTGSRNIDSDPFGGSDGE